MGEIIQLSEALLSQDGSTQESVYPVTVSQAVYDSNEKKYLDEVIKTMKAQQITFGGAIDVTNNNVCTQIYAELTTDDSKAFFICSDSSGSVSGGHAVCTTALAKVLHPSDSRGVAVNLGDVLLVSRLNGTYYFKLLPVNEAKKPSDASNVGTYGLMVPNDKEKLDKAVDDIDKTVFRTYQGEFNMNYCGWYGYYQYCTLGRPAGSVTGENYVLRVANGGNDGDYIVLEQTAYSCSDPTRVFRRIVKTKDRSHMDVDGNTVWGEWKQIGAEQAQSIVTPYFTVYDTSVYTDSQYLTANRTAFTELFALGSGDGLRDAIIQVQEADNKHYVFSNPMVSSDAASAACVINKYSGSGDSYIARLVTCKFNVSAGSCIVEDKEFDTDLFVLVTALPTSDIKDNKIYLVPGTETTTNNIYTEYMYVNNSWEIIGQIQAEVDLSAYAKTEDVNTQLATKADASDVTNLQTTVTYLDSLGKVYKLSNSETDNAALFTKLKTGDIVMDIPNSSIHIVTEKLSTTASLEGLYTGDGTTSGILGRTLMLTSAGTYTITDYSLDNATSETAGLMSADDKTKLDKLLVSDTVITILTQEEYDALETKDENTVYLIKGTDED